ncbi:MAG: hypothetical protein DRO00_10340 [Thermoproteota archaeon]|nr:MAG: hypothetical protein DRO00_10340 [Candidatus Korarchaeota archaeon]
MVYIASARGQKADWFRNILANPYVEVQVNGRRFRGLAEPIKDLSNVVDFLECDLYAIL